MFVRALVRSVFVMVGHEGGMWREVGKELHNARILQSTHHSWQVGSLPTRQASRVWRQRQPGLTSQRDLVEAVGR